MTWPKVARYIVTGSLLLNAWLGFNWYQAKSQNDLNLTVAEEQIAYRLDLLTQYADLPEAQWDQASTRSGLYYAMATIIHHGWTASETPTSGKRSGLAQNLGDVADQFVSYRNVAERLAFDPQGATPADRAKIQGLALMLKETGWKVEHGPAAPSDGAQGRNWSALKASLDKLSAAK